ncbi:MAG: GvpL/GvpF family gas vesicle protein [Elusimicrobia bacterium]|nr:GvpL/GvpF family gas vesicle protein [Elusimicrobiota bacterium]
MTQTASQIGRYIYCIIGSGRPQTFGPLGIGGRGDQLYTITFDGIAAVVSDSPIKSYPLSHDNLIAHEKAIEEVMKGHCVLPVRFCTIAADDDKVKEILVKARDRFRDLLRAMAGKKELGLKAVFKYAIYKDILENYPNIKSLKENLAALPFDQTQTGRMEIGRLVESALQMEKERRKDGILAALSPLAAQVKINNNYGELMILSAAFLVEERNETSFDQRVDQLDAKYGDKVKFKYVGTLPPFNFVNLVIDTRQTNLVAAS